MSNTGEFSSCYKLTCTESVSKDLHGEEVVIQPVSRESSAEDPHFPRLNVAQLLVTSAPSDATPGFPGDLKFVVPPTGTTGGFVYYCRAGTGQATGNTWIAVGIGEPAGV